MRLTKQKSFSHRPVFTQSRCNEVDFLAKAQSGKILESLDQFLDVVFLVGQIGRDPKPTASNRDNNILFCPQSPGYFHHLLRSFLVRNEADQVVRTRTTPNRVPVLECPLEKGFGQSLELQLGLGNIDSGNFLHGRSQHREEQRIRLSAGIKFACISVVSFGVASGSHFVFRHVPRVGPGLEIPAPSVKIQWDPIVLYLR
mmetsp:Transcript_13448/g.37843  ORF Transcript_13448/g.37843 Transcript_13448/m.37843 type:complete len:200 (-) Transcript_13448:122-721(-)